jgi:hypothetical protein
VPHRTHASTLRLVFPTVKHRNVRMSVGLALPVVAFLVAHFVAGMGEGVEMLAPALLLFSFLLNGRYVGEQTIDRVRRSRAVPVRRRCARRPAPRRGHPRRVPRGGLLVAASLATRPPPLTL